MEERCFSNVRETDLRDSNFWSEKPQPDFRRCQHMTFNGLHLPYLTYGNHFKF